MAMPTPTDNGGLSFMSCAFCPTEKRADNLYKCPRCTAFYCSVRCFRCQKHSKCSEQFYRGECEQYAAQENESSASSSSATNGSSKIAPFEQYMEKEEAEQLNSRKGGKRRANPQIAVRADEEILFDSDDEPEYLSKIAASTLEQFEEAGMDDEELNRRLLGAGLPLGMEEADEGKPYPTDTQEHLEQLYQHLTDEEKRKFTELAEGMFQDEFQAMTNCFAKKKTKQ